MKKFLEGLQESKSINGLLILVGIGVIFTSLLSVALQLSDYMTNLPSFGRPSMELTVMAAQTATDVKVWQTAINATAAALNIPTYTPTPGFRETQYAVLEPTVRAENTALRSVEIQQTVVELQLLLPTTTPDPMEVAREIEVLTTDRSGYLGNVFWALIVAAAIAVVSLLLLIYGITSIGSDIRQLVWFRAVRRSESDDEVET